MSFIGFNAEEYTPAVGMVFSVTPEGKYRAVITKTSMEPTSKGDGEKIVFTCEIIEGPESGAEVRFNVNFRNPKALAQRIGRQELSAICHAVGVLTPSETDELHNIPFILEIGVSADGKWNELKGVEPDTASAPPKKKKPAPKPEPEEEEEEEEEEPAPKKKKKPQPEPEEEEEEEEEEETPKKKTPSWIKPKKD